jgi:hypothetical protein
MALPAVPLPPAWPELVPACTVLVPPLEGEPPGAPLLSPERVPPVPACDGPSELEEQPRSSATISGEADAREQVSNGLQLRILILYNIVRASNEHSTSRLPLCDRRATSGHRTNSLTVASVMLAVSLKRESAEQRRSGHQPRECR